MKRINYVNLEISELMQSKGKSYELIFGWVKIMIWSFFCPFCYHLSYMETVDDMYRWLVNEMFKLINEMPRKIEENSENLSLKSKIKVASGKWNFKKSKKNRRKTF